MIKPSGREWGESLQRSCIIASVQQPKLPSGKQALVYDMQGKQAWRRITQTAEEGGEFFTLLGFPDTQVAFYIAMLNVDLVLCAAGVC